MFHLICGARQNSVPTFTFKFPDATEPLVVTCLVGAGVISFPEDREAKFRGLYNQPINVQPSPKFGHSQTSGDSGQTRDPKFMAKNWERF